MKILIDNGHGENTLGKRSPDGKFREYLWAREIAVEITKELLVLGYDAERLVRENIDVPLSERVNRVNAECRKYGSSKVMLVSVHCNASGYGSKWMSASGWSAYTYNGKSKSDVLAEMLYEAAEIYFPDRRIRRDTSDGDSDFEAGFEILKSTKCAAVLTENFFMDNRQDVEFLQSAAGKKAVVQAHVQAIIQYVERYG